MPLPSSDRLLYSSIHGDRARGRVVGLISIDESFACRMEATGQDIPWESLVAEWSSTSSVPACDEVIADVDRLAQDLAAEFAALVAQR